MSSPQPNPDPLPDANPPDALPFYKEVPVNEVRSTSATANRPPLMPGEWRTWSGFRQLIHDARLDLGAFWFYHYLYDKMDSDGKVRGRFANQQAIASDRAVTTKTIERWTRQLIDSGWLRTERPDRRAQLTYVPLNGLGVLAKFVKMTKPQLELPLPPYAIGRPPSRPDTNVGSNASRPDTNVGSNASRPDTNAGSHIICKVPECKEGRSLPQVKLSPPEHVTRSRELQEVEGRLKKIKDSYDSHAEWSNQDRDTFRKLSGHRANLRRMLGYVEIH